MTSEELKALAKEFIETPRHGLDGHEWEEIYLIPALIELLERVQREAFQNGLKKAMELFPLNPIKGKSDPI